MLNGFETITASLTKHELEDLTPLLVGFLSDKKGEDKAVKSFGIQCYFKSFGYNVSDARIRKLINHVRIKGLVKNLIATSRGYYIATDANQIKSYVESLVSRENAIRAVRYSFCN
jgi:hypothetical protein